MSLLSSSLTSVDTAQAALPVEDDVIHPVETTAKRDITERRRNGVFYTPASATKLLAQWAIRTRTESVLEPSFGGCGFLQAASQQLQTLGALQPESQLYGCDIESEAFEHLSKEFSGRSAESHFRKKDFLKVEPGDFAIPSFDVVLGNPPYVSWHNMSLEQRQSASTVKVAKGRELYRRGSLWTFFVAHSLHFLKPGGRMAWILPGSFLYADYALALRELIASSFERSLAVSLDQRIFLDENTEESTVVLLCEGYNAEASSAMHLVAAKDVVELSNVLDAWRDREKVGVAWGREANYLLSNTEAISVYEKLRLTSACHTLGNLAKIRIGLVTGANDFFVLRPSQAKAFQLPLEALRPIVGRLNQFRGADFTPEDFAALQVNDERCLLVDTGVYPEANMPDALEDYLTRLSKEEIAKNWTFAKRDPWHQVKQERTPDAFFSCMSQIGPMLTINSARVQCTNTVYQVEFHKQTQLSLAAPPDPRQIAISLQSTFSQFSAELQGRGFGAGALKIEPSQAARITLLLSSGEADQTASASFKKANDYLRHSKSDEARQVADELLIHLGMVNVEDVASLEEGLNSLRAMRRGIRNKPV